MSFIRRIAQFLGKATKILGLIVAGIIAGFFRLFVYGAGMVVGITVLGFIVNSVDSNLDAKHMNANADAYADYLADRAADRRTK